MVKVEIKQKNPDNEDEFITKELIIDGYLKSNLDLGIEQLHKDFDQVWFVDGGEGAGKSDLAIQCAYYVNREETRNTIINRICLTVETFEQAIKDSQPYDALVLDEAFSGMSASGAMTSINRALQKTFTEIRAKNLFIFIVAPSFMDIQRYFAVWRSKCLLHVYLGSKKERGFVAFFGENKKKRLYIEGKKKYYSYGVVKADFICRFKKQLHVCVEKSLYDAKKSEVTYRDKRFERVTTAERKFKFTIAGILEKNLGKLPTPTELSAETGDSDRNSSRILKEIRESRVSGDNYSILT